MHTDGRSNRFSPARGARALRVVLMATALALSGAAVAQDKPAARPEVGKPLQTAQELAKKGQHKQALAEIQKADKVAGKSPYEQFLVDQTQAYVYLGMKQPEKAAEALEAAMKAGNLSPEDRKDRLGALAKLHYQAGNYDQAVDYGNRAIKEGADDGTLRVLVAQALFTQKKFNDAAQMIQPAIQAAEKAGKPPQEDWLQMAANAYHQSGDKKNFVDAMERLVRHYPNPDYWDGLLSVVTQTPGFSDRLNFDVEKLRLATGSMGAPEQYTEMAQQALLAKFPNEARAILDRGVKDGKLGTGPDAARHQRLLEYATKQAEEGQAALAAREQEAQAAKTGDALIDAGRAYASYGMYPKAIAAMEAGMKKGGITRPEHARLRYGVTLLEAGQDVKAQQVLKSVKGTDGSAQLARLWLLHKRPQVATAAAQ